MTPYYSDPYATIYLGDCLELLPQLPAASANAVATDPPYLLGASSTRRGERAQSPIADWTNASRWYRDWLGRCFRACTDAAPVWMFGNWRTLPVLEIAVQSLARRITSVLVWDKQWIGVGSMNGLRCQYELVFLMGGSEFSISDRCLSDIWQERWASSRPNGHPQEKPLPLARRMLDVSGLASDAVCLDPFCGSGTTLVAAKEMGRKAVGIEIHEPYAEIAANRLSQGVLDYGDRA